MINIKIKMWGINDHAELWKPNYLIDTHGPSGFWRTIYLGVSLYACNQVFSS